VECLKEAGGSYLRPSAALQVWGTARGGVEEEFKL